MNADAGKSIGSQSGKEELRLITCVVQRGKSDMIAKAAIAVGASGVTILEGRGMGLRERLGILGKAIVPKKEVLMIVCKEEEVHSIFEVVVKVARLNTPGMGIAYIIPIYEVAGLVPARFLR